MRSGEKNAEEMTMKERLSLIISLKLVGLNKMSAFKATSSSMAQVYQSILAAGGVNVDMDDVMPSRRMVMRTVNSQAERIRNIIKAELTNKHVTIIHDDSRKLSKFLSFML